jgi:hypothetical protein
MGSLAASVNESALSSVKWNINAPFNLLRNVFEYIVTGWKQTLYTAFNNRSLRMDIFKGIIIINIKMVYCNQIWWLPTSKPTGNQKVGHCQRS